MQQIKSFFLDPNPKQFFYLILAYSILVLPISYMTIDHLLAIVSSAGLIALLTYVYQFQSQEKIQDQKIVYFIPSLIVCGYLILYGGILFRGNLVENKQQLQQVTGIIPSESKYVRGHGKGARSRDYLVINSTHLHCAEDEMNSCEKMYQYQGKTATVYYQADSHVGGLAYEIVVDNQKIYTFEQQLNTFKQHRQNENKKLAWAILLFLLPSIYFYILSRDVLGYVTVVSSKEEIEQLQLKAKEKERSENKNLGLIGWGSRIIGYLLLFYSLMQGFSLFIGIEIEKAVTASQIFSTILLFALSLVLLFYIPKQIIQKNQRKAQAETPPALPDSPPMIRLTDRPTPPPLPTSSDVPPVQSNATPHAMMSEQTHSEPNTTTAQRKFRQRPQELEKWQKILRIVLLILFIPISLFMIALSLFAIFTGERTLSNIIATAIIVCVCIVCIWIVKKLWSWKHRVPKSKRQRRY